MFKTVRLCASMALFAAATGAFAQAWPAKPVTLVVKEAVSIAEVRDRLIGQGAVPQASTPNEQ